MICARHGVQVCFFARRHFFLFLPHSPQYPVQSLPASCGQPFFSFQLLSEVEMKHVGSERNTRKCGALCARTREGIEALALSGFCAGHHRQLSASHALQPRNI